MSGVLHEQKFGGFRGNLSHLGDETAVAPVIAVIVDPFLVDPGDQAHSLQVHAGTLVRRDQALHHSTHYFD
ncbi:MAG: hypothetical protein HQ453_11750 [Actinobacteria bacterium]|nr:hypothetical protein [Actinomycetota bacterium]